MNKVASRSSILLRFHSNPPSGPPLVSSHLNRSNTILNGHPETDKRVRFNEKHVWLHKKITRQPPPWISGSSSVYLLANMNAQ
ncbi:hypothetical protein PROFUN_03797 [Planoprotostelium fungivorum]|uniref:Uncharacterized protein n=1 Tax=Planoprotostelium fungivorum TaxID=1890364 RepID=A0A2P6NI82_9EUKA|nr:hypothetical protein PROFUN_03797 [Planoprotostelium fungivorum]